MCSPGTDLDIPLLRRGTPEADLLILSVGARGIHYLLIFISNLQGLAINSYDGYFMDQFELWQNELRMRSVKKVCKRLFEPFYFRVVIVEALVGFGDLSLDGIGL